MCILRVCCAMTVDKKKYEAFIFICELLFEIYGTQIEAFVSRSTSWNCFSSQSYTSIFEIVTDSDKTSFKSCISLSFSYTRVSCWLVINSRYLSVYFTFFSSCLAEILELSGNAARDYKRTRIIPRHILLSTASDLELNQVNYIEKKTNKIKT